MQLLFKFGVMGCGKSARLLIDLRDYDKRHIRGYVIKPSIDTRDGEYVSSRIEGMNRKADLIVSPNDVIDEDNILSCAKYVFVDEAQFLSDSQVESLWRISRRVPVACYGLRTDFLGKLFNGSKRLMELADSIEKIESLCNFCDRNAMWNLRLLNGEPTFDGPQVQIGADESYSPCCKHCVIDFSSICTDTR